MELKNFFAQDTTGNVISEPIGYLYEPGTTTLVTGLQDKNGAPLANPFTGTTNGLLQFAAPDGEYDLRVTGSGRDFTIRVQFLDVSDAVAAAEAARDDAEAAAADAVATLSTAVLLTGAQTVDGVKTFSSSPVLPTPGGTGENSTKAASTSWVQSVLSALAVLLTGDQTIAGTKTFSSSPVVPTVAGGTDSTTKAASTAFVQSALTAFKATANAFTKGQSVAFVALTDGANIAVDGSLSNNFKVTLGGNRTLDNPTNLNDGQVLNFRFKQDGTGSRTLAYGTKYTFPGGADPVLSTDANDIDLMSCVYDSAEDKLFCNMTKDYS